MILSDTEIKVALQYGQLQITPQPEENQYATSSVDLRLGAKFWRWQEVKPGRSQVLDPSQTDFKFSDLADLLEDYSTNHDGAIDLPPRGFVLATTLENVRLPSESRLAARVEGRSSLARLGVGVHITAPTIHAGFQGEIALEITNHSNQVVRLRPGLHVCQLVVEQVFGTPTTQLRSQFQGQQDVVGPVDEPQTGQVA